MSDTENNAYSIRKCDLSTLMETNTIRVPKIQRDYAQGRDNDVVNDIRSKFVHDLVTAISPSGSPIELDFVYGSYRKDAFEPLDGQQRLTTLFLLHWICGVNLYDKEKDLAKLTYETRGTSSDFCLELVKHAPKQFLDEIARSVAYKKEQTDIAEAALNALKNTSMEQRGSDFAKLVEEAKKNLSAAKSLPEKSFSSMIRDRDWFNYLWNFDPTIQSMLVMLDALHKEFLTRKIDIASCKDNLNRITFSDLNLDDLNLPDELFIKMNARGKQLSSFDVLKSSLEEEIQVQKAESHCTTVIESCWRSLIDGEWIDWFWNMFAADQIGAITAPDEDYKKRLSFAKVAEENLKRLILRCVTLHFVRKDNINSRLADFCYKDQIDNLNRLLVVYNDALRAGRSNGDVPDPDVEISFPEIIDDLKALYYRDSKGIYHSVLSAIPERFFINSGENSKSYLALILGDRCSNDGKIVFYALLRYVRLIPVKISGDNLDSTWVDDFIEWAHFARNLFINENNNVRIDDAVNFKTALTGVDLLLNELTQFAQKPSYSTISFIDSLRGKTFSGVDNQSLAEEVEKAGLKLSDNGEWKTVLENTESHAYLWGQVRCLLDWSSGDRLLFEDYSKRLLEIFDYPDKNQVYAGILSVDPSYGFTNNKLYQFSNKHRDYGFKRFLRDEGFKAKGGIYAPAIKATLDKWRTNYPSLGLKDFLRATTSDAIKTGHSYVNCLLEKPGILNEAWDKMIFESDGHYVIAQRKTSNSHCFDIALKFLQYSYRECKTLSGEVVFYDSVGKTYKHAVIIPYGNDTLLIMATANGGYSLSVNDSHLKDFIDEKEMLDYVLTTYPA